MYNSATVADANYSAIQQVQEPDSLEEIAIGNPYKRKKTFIKSHLLDKAEAAAAAINAQKQQ